MYGIFIDDEMKKKQAEEEKRKAFRWIEEGVDTLFAETAQIGYGYELRDGQYAMAMEIAEAVSAGHHLIVEAGVGIGKSFAYLAPLLLYHQRLGEPVAVATSTITLQEQLAGDVQKVAQMLDIKADVLIAKGQSHYICRKAFEDAGIRDICLKEKVKEIIEEGGSERNNFPIEIPENIWEKICVSRYSKQRCRKTCPYVSGCVYHDLRRNMLSAGFIICNQDLLTAHLMHISDGIEPILNPGIKLVVVDEAHNLEEKVRSATTRQYTRNQLMRIVSGAADDAERRGGVYSGSVGKHAASARARIGKLFDNLNAQRLKQQKRMAGRPGNSERLFIKNDNGAFSLIRRLASSVTELKWDVDIAVGFDFGQRKSADRIDLEELAKRFSELDDDFNNYILWIENTDKGIAFSFCPKGTAGLIDRLFFQMEHRTVLTSATLTGKSSGSLEEQYAYLIKNTGYPYGETAELSEPKESPFDYDCHAMIYYCGDLPHPIKQREDFIKAGTDRLVELLGISKGRALVLFTAKSDMEDVAALLKKEKLPYNILVQEEGSSQEKTLEQFREDTDFVLLGTGAYWEGINVEGVSLSHVVVFRLPFPVPDPIMEYKRSVSSDYMKEVMVPEMIIKLKQGIGRLIRSEKDKGIVSILDGRMGDGSRAGYKDTVWEALPIKNKTMDMAEIRDFYNRVMAENIR